MLIHKGTQTLTTERLVLRKFKKKDAVSMFKNWASDPDVTKYLSWNVHLNVEITKEIVDIWIYQYEKLNVYNWAIIDSASNEAIGGISVVQMDAGNNSCEIGYCISSAHWNKGVVTEALKAVIEFLFKEVGFNRIAAKHDALNIASGKVMQKCAMHFEGISREIKRREDGTYYDLVTYAILMKDYVKNQDDKMMITRK